MDQGFANWNMNDIFLTTFLTNSAALGKIMLIALIAGILVRRKIFSSLDIVSISSLTVKVLLPAMIYSKIVKTLDPVAFPDWWKLPLVGIGLIAIGVIFAVIFFAKELPAKKNMLPIASMQNAGYLALPLGQVIYPVQFDLYALYCFLIIMGLNPILWSVGKLLSTNIGEERFSWKKIVTPPFAANILGVITVLTGLKNYIPDFAIDVIDLTGSATVPIANFILGAVIGSISLRIWPSLADVARVLSIKFLIIPALTILLMVYWNLKDSNSLLSDTILIQAASPPATAILIQIKNYGGDEQTAGSTMLIAYLFCLFAIPIWLAVWRTFF